MCCKYCTVFKVGAKNVVQCVGGELGNNEFHKNFKGSRITDQEWVCAFARWRDVLNKLLSRVIISKK